MTAVDELPKWVGFAQVREMRIAARVDSLGCSAKVIIESHRGHQDADRHGSGVHLNR